MSGRHTQRCFRNATSLVELLVVMSAATVVLTMSANLIHRVMQAHSQATGRLRIEQTAVRLSTQFRADVHLATSVTTPTESESILGIELADGISIEYDLTAETVERKVKRDGQVFARETYAFPAKTVWSIEDRLSPRRLLLFSRSPDGVAPVIVHIEACLGRSLSEVRI